MLERLLRPEIHGNERWNIFITIFVTRLIVVILALLFAWNLWKALRPEKLAPDRARVQAANLCAQTIRDELRERRGDYRSLVCTPFAGDSSGVVFEATRNVIATSGTFDVCDRSFGERLGAFFNARTSGSNDAERAARTARRRKADAALCGTVLRFETVDGRAQLLVDYRLIDASTGKETFAGTYDSTSTEETPNVVKAGIDESPALTSIQEASQSALFNFALWILAVLAIPIFAFRALEAATAKRSNGANAFALTVCLLADAAFALILLRPAFDGKYRFLIVALMALFAIWYDAQILRLAYRRTSDVCNQP